MLFVGIVGRKHFFPFIKADIFGFQFVFVLSKHYPDKTRLIDRCGNYAKATRNSDFMHYLPVVNDAVECFKRLFLKSDRFLQISARYIARVDIAAKSCRSGFGKPAYRRFYHLPCNSHSPVLRRNKKIAVVPE